MASPIRRPAQDAKAATSRQFEKDAVAAKLHAAVDRLSAESASKDELVIALVIEALVIGARPGSKITIEGGVALGAKLRIENTSGSVEVSFSDSMWGDLVHLLPSMRAQHFVRAA